MDGINQADQLIGILKIIMGNPWLLLFAALFLVGFMLKEHTTFNNKLIPWVIFILGIFLGLILIQLSLPGAIIGGVMAWIIIGFYEQIKSTMEFKLQIKSNKSEKKV